ncbi:(Fe-S)-binding protein [Persicobacter psychrovividus]|uniref:Fe-S oxidoreductase n=1 Tax=Persicobacter psychrovividus TaxID=387638 RepID=A0ABM7VGW0_9BACT|nr:Fe-S oxidoreductase [Persicobacter psychrovividus]
MSLLSQLFFLILLGVSAFFIGRRILQIRKNILLGKEEDRTDQPQRRLKTMLLVAFGQKKMFKRPIAAFLHLLIYVGFLLINLEVLEIVLDGLFGTHRLFAPLLGSFYPVLINFFEFLVVGVIFSCVVFLIRRHVLKISRFTKIEMKGWPTMDATLILVIELVLMVAILAMNGADQVLQTKAVAGYPVTGAFFFSSIFIPLFEPLSANTLIIIERVAWWGHIAGIFAFAYYITYSKHLHIFLAFPNTYFSNLKEKGEIKNMDNVTNEVKSMLGLPADPPPAEIPRFGAKDINDLSWKHLMDAYACTECGRCTDSCPANTTGKVLSPRTIMMKTRDRAEEVGESIRKGGAGLEDGKSLYGDYINKEELLACTTCNACVEACPITIDPLSIIIEMRRYMAMEESSTPQSWNAMFQNVETSFAPWKFPPTDRFNWAQDVKAKISDQ